MAAASLGHPGAAANVGDGGDGQSPGAGHALAAGCALFHPTGRYHQQLKHIFGIPVTATGVVQTVQQLVRGAPQLNLTTTGIGLGALGLLAFSRAALPRILRQLGVSAGAAGLCAKLAPMLAVVLGTVAVTLGQWHLTAGVKVVGQVPAGLPALAVVWPDSQSLSMLWLPALLIAVVGFVESVSVAHSLALKRQQRQWIQQVELPLHSQ